MAFLFYFPLAGMGQNKRWRELVLLERKETRGGMSWTMAAAYYNNEEQRSKHSTSLNLTFTLRKSGVENKHFSWQIPPRESDSAISEKPWRNCPV